MTWTWPECPPEAKSMYSSWLPGGFFGVDVFVVGFGGDGSDVRDLVLQLRRDGFAADRAYGGRSPKAQMKQADRSGAAHVGRERLRQPAHLAVGDRTRNTFERRGRRQRPIAPPPVLGSHAGRALAFHCR